MRIINAKNSVVLTLLNPQIIKYFEQCSPGQLAQESKFVWILGKMRELENGYLLFEFDLLLGFWLKHLCVLAICKVENKEWNTHKILGLSFIFWKKLNLENFSTWPHNNWIQHYLNNRFSNGLHFLFICRFPSNFTGKNGRSRKLVSWICEFFTEFRSNYASVA